MTVTRVAEKVVMIITLIAAALMFEGCGSSESHQKEAAQHAKDIFSACVLYTSKPGHSRFPPRLSEVVVDQNLDPKLLITSWSGTSPIVEPSAGTDWKKIADEVDSHSDFIYVGNKLDAGYAWQIVLYTKPGIVSGGRVICYAGGFTEFVPDTQLGEKFDQNNRTRNGSSLPEIKLDQR